MGSRDEAFVEFKVRIYGWREVEPSDPYERMPDKAIDVWVKGDAGEHGTSSRVRGRDAAQQGADLLEYMRNSTIRQAIDNYLKECEVNVKAEKLGREMAEAQFDHRPNELMPEDFYT